MPGQTPSQTVGPFFAFGLTPESYGRRGIADGMIAGPRVVGRRLTIEGRVLDGAGGPVNDALVEVWQANTAGRYCHPADHRWELPLEAGFRGFGRIATDPEGRYRVVTVKPGRVPGPGNSLQAPHLNLIIFARGMLSHLYTRIYFGDEVDANGEDPILALVEAARRGTLITRIEEHTDGCVHVFDIRLQGPEETVFFDA